MSRQDACVPLPVLLERSSRLLLRLEQKLKTTFYLLDTFWQHYLISPYIYKRMSEMQ